jgi:hypothetical protein
VLAHHADEVATAGLRRKLVTFNTRLGWYIDVAGIAKSVQVSDVRDRIRVADVSVPGL